jgi:ABC-type sugar transport system substrate-binding protein
MSALPARTPVTPASPQPAPVTAPRRKNVMSALLNRTPVLWFLFLFNAAVAIAAVAAGSHLPLHRHGHSLRGSQQVTTAAGMGIIALGAGAALFLRRPKRA